MESTLPNGSPVIEVRRPRVRRKRRLDAMLVAIICIAVALVTWRQWPTRGQAGQLTACETWARQTTLMLRTLPGGEKLSVGAPVRMKAYVGPDFYLSVSGYVLDEQTEARLRAAFDAAGPPKDVRINWRPWNCGGDAELFNQMEAEILEDDPVPAK